MRNRGRPLKSPGFGQGEALGYHPAVDDGHDDICLRPEAAPAVVFNLGGPAPTGLHGRQSGEIKRPRVRAIKIIGQRLLDPVFGRIAQLPLRSPDVVEIHLIRLDSHVERVAA